MKTLKNTFLSILSIFALGMGLTKIAIPLAMISLYKNKGRLKTIFRKNSIYPYFYTLPILSAVFLLTYFFCYEPYKPDLYTTEKHYFIKLCAMSFVALTLPLALTTTKNLIDAIWIFCFGAFFFAAATMLASILLKSPPYYGQIIDIRAMLAGSIKYGNSPGIANLLSFFMIAFQASLLLNPSIRPANFWAIGAIGILMSIPSGILIEQRTFFLLVLVIQPVIVGTLLLLDRLSYQRLLVLILTASTYPLILGIEKFFHITLIKRGLNDGPGLLNDPRVQMNQYWLEHFIHNPFKRIEVGPQEWDYLPWFHNFFSDVHRVSGFWAMLAGIVLLGFIFFRLTYLLKINKELGGFLLAIAIPTFLIMNTSVVPEGEKQPFILLLLIGSVCERLIQLRQPKHAL